MENDQERRWTVYLHVVPKQLTGYDWDKYYVGITGQSIQERWGGAGQGYFSQSYFYNAIKKYGWNKIRHLILREFLTKKEAIEWEKEYIRLYNSHNLKHGYNLTDGGEGTNGMKHSKAAKEKMSHNRSGTKNAFYGRKHTNETKILISKHHADVKGGNNPNHKKVYQFDLKGNFIAEYSSLSEASRIVGVTESGISAVALNRQKTHGGYIWKYDNEVMNNSNGSKTITSEYCFTPKRLTNKEIREFDINGNLLAIYPSAKAVSQKYSIPNRYAAIARGAYKKRGNEFERRLFKDKYYFYTEDSELIDCFLNNYISNRKEYAE